ncbi:MAG TPA: NADPH-dependent FMN reductase [Stellaceae bacterium]|jgi:chromate reductase|nr:NADPH-dependent FMN reductase [Stellaceae bacterium]
MQPNVKDIAMLVGSQRKDSINRKAALALAGLAPPSLRLDLVEIGHLPFYNQEFDADPAQTPAPYSDFRRRLARADGVLFATPEYNRSYPAVLKNAIDIGTRPYGKSIWADKPAGVISVSLGALGAFGANQHLRQLLANVNMRVLQQPEIYLASADKLFDADGNVTVDSTRDLLCRFMDAFAGWVQPAKAIAA